MNVLFERIQILLQSELIPCAVMQVESFGQDTPLGMLICADSDDGVAHRATLCFSGS